MSLRINSLHNPHKLQLEINFIHLYTLSIFQTWIIPHVQKIRNYPKYEKILHNTQHTYLMHSKCQCFGFNFFLYICIKLFQAEFCNRVNFLQIRIRPEKKIRIWINISFVGSGSEGQKTPAPPMPDPDPKLCFQVNYLF